MSTLSIQSAPSTATGSVTSVSGSGGTTGLTLAGGPITTTGTLTIGGILIGANGGTGVANTGKTITLGGNFSTDGVISLTVAALTTQFLSGDGTYRTPAGATFANPSASVGLAAVNGSATTAMRSDAAPALDVTITPTWTGLHTFLKAGIGTAQTDAVFLNNSTAAAVGAQQFSPSLHWAGQGWKTTATAASQTTEFRAFVRPTQGTTNPLGTLVFQSQTNGAGWNDTLQIDDGGATQGNLIFRAWTGGSASSSTCTIKSTSGAGSTDAIIFQVGNNGATEAMRCLTDGRVAIGTASPTLSGYLLTIEKSQSANTGPVVYNPNTGVAGQASVTVGTQISSVFLAQLGSGFTTSNMFVASGSYLYSNGTVGLHILTSASAPIKFGANNTQRGQLSAAGGWSFGTTTDPGANNVLFGADVQFQKTITAGGTTGNQTINKSSGTVNVAAGGTSITVTNSLCTTSSIIQAMVRTNDTTAQVKNVVPGSGSFVINMVSAVTAETSIGFLITN